jgi:hypothetical protein
MKIKTIAIIVGILLILGGVFSLNKTGGVLGMQILSRHSTCKTATATSTLIVIASTTYPAIAATLICDAYNLDSSNYDATPIDSAVLALQYTAASTTASNLTTTITYSNDGIDWYTPKLDEDSIATTSIVLTNTVTTVVKTLYDIATPSRYVKATFTTTYTGGAGTSSVYAEFIPKKSVNK